VVGFGDATGHGLSAGIVVTAVKALFGALPPEAAPAEILGSCDRVLRGMRFGRLQMCLAVTRLTPRSAALASAAMPPALRHRAAGGAVEELGVGGLPLGGRLAATWSERSTSLSPGDTLLLASDGFAELSDPGGRPLGYPGAAEAFRRAAAGRDARAVLEALEREAAAWRGERRQEDDVTFLVVRVTT
jgi:sigma-B regulation protein RsbU (phosphoserine phosphatase)